MLLKEILEEADLLVSNSVTQEQKIRFFNQIQRMIYRDFPNPLQTLTFTTTPGVSLYTMSISPDRVKQVFVNDEEYLFQDEKEENCGTVYSFLNDELFIQPTPTQTLDGYVLYDGVPADVTMDDWNNEPPFLKDFHDIFAFGIAQKAALIGKDYKTSDELETRFQTLLTKAMKQTPDRKTSTVHMTYGGL
jgi:hypothetical protein